MSKAEQQHKGRLADFGCIVCRRVYNVHTPAQIHHPRQFAGAGQRSSDFLAIPLCPIHHQTGGHGIAIHAGERTFEMQFGTETELLADTIRRIFYG